ncbi:hypothetical protein E3H11_11930 [Bradyrhizobium brasilense]|uniref:hypothetical protein n=1 Tax=Bradyrhizobium brasilense TaxID=1419277 RepID=UPI0014565243|nr:hypothetical protein [Bradyrhizobium brasilense]NLS69611.1 hypothetical protein [Bradyrhizobium brasilense]
MVSAAPHWSLNEERTRIRIDFQGERPIRLELDADQLDDVIAGLVEMRSSMSPEVPMSDPDPGSRVLVATRGRFFVQSRENEKSLAVLLLHPGLRWVGMLFDRDGVLDLIDKLRRYLPHPPESK